MEAELADRLLELESAIIEIREGLDAPSWELAP
jgi:hypothetical protein